METWKNRMELRKEYMKTKRMLMSMRRKLNVSLEGSADPAIKIYLESQIESITESISDVTFIIDWLKTGKMPGSRRGIENLSYDQRTIVMNPLLLQCYRDRSVAGSRVHVDEVQREKIDQVLSILSEMERECYLMHVAGGMSMSKIGYLLKVKKRTVQSYIERAKKKIQAYVAELHAS